ncbi:hypothetical protein ACLB2K_028236 [Fragaria x ananassa]
MILASGLLPAFHSLDIHEGLTRAISPGMIFGGRVIVPYSWLSQVFWLCTNKSPSPQSERALGWGVILQMPRIGFIQVLEAWCRVPKSPREGRKFALVGEKKRANGVACRYGATQFALVGEKKRANGVACRYRATQFALVGEETR